MKTHKNFEKKKNFSGIGVESRGVEHGGWRGARPLRDFGPSIKAPLKIHQKALFAPLEILEKGFRPLREKIPTPTMVDKWFAKGALSLFGFIKFSPPMDVNPSIHHCTKVGSWQQGF